MSNFFKNHKAQIIKLAIMLLILAAISIISLLVLEAFGVVYYSEDGMHINPEPFDEFRNSWYSWIIFILIKIATSFLLCFIPGSSMAYVLLAQVSEF